MDKSYMLDYDHKIIVIDSSTAIFPSSNICDFYIDLDESLKNVYKIKIITILVNIDNIATVNINKNLESIYIDLNNYSRLITKMSPLSANKQNGNAYFFDSLIIESEDTNIPGFRTIKNDYNNADIEYYLNPIEHQLSRFRVRLFSKDNIILPTTNTINRFVMKLGIYYNNRKNTIL